MSYYTQPYNQNQNFNFNPANQFRVQRPNQNRPFYMYSNYQNQQYNQRKKHSGCKIMKHKDGRTIVSAWKYSRKMGMLSIIGIENHSSETKSSRWFKMTLQAVNKNTGETRTYSALWDSQKNKVVIGTIGWILNPNAPNGGYCGKGGYPMKIRRN